MRARARVRGRAPAFPCAPAPASCPPRSDANRISNARSHTPGRSHSRARAPLRRTPGSARPTRPPGATTKSPERGQRRSLANLRPLPGWPRLRSLGAPRGEPSGVPAAPPCHAGPRPRSLNPGWGAQLGLPALAPKGAGSLLARATARSRVLSCSFLSPLLSLPLLDLLSFLLISPFPPPDSGPLSLPLSPATSPPPSPAPSAARRPARPHILRITLVPPAARRAQGWSAQWAARVPAGPGPAVPSALHSLCGSSLRPDGRRRPALAWVVADSSHLSQA